MYGADLLGERSFRLPQAKKEIQSQPAGRSKSQRGGDSTTHILTIHPYRYLYVSLMSTPSSSSSSSVVGSSVVTLSTRDSILQRSGRIGQTKEETTRPNINGATSTTPYSSPPPNRVMECFESADPSEPQQTTGQRQTETETQRERVRESERDQQRARRRAVNARMDKNVVWVD